MDIIKYIYEEPVLLEAIPAEGTDSQSGASGGMRDGGPYFRGYLAGSSLEPKAVGLTAVAHPGAFVEPLVHIFGDEHWHRVDSRGRMRAVPPRSIRKLLAGHGDTALLFLAGAPAEAAAVEAAATDRRRAMDALKRLLDESAVVLFCEPAHDGSDWSLYSARPLKDRMVDAFREHPLPGVRRFVLPFQRARAEERFYFEFWSLGDLPAYVTEIK